MWRFTLQGMYGVKVGDRVVSRRKTEVLLAEGEGWVLGR